MSAQRIPKQRPPKPRQSPPASRSASSAKHAPRPGMKKIARSKQASSLRWFWFWLGLTGVAMLSATAGAFLAVSLTTTPLMQRQLTAEEAAVFEDDRIATRMNVRLPELTRPVNILVLGIKVLSSDLDEPPAEARNLGYHSLVNSFDGLSDTMLLLRFNPQDKRLVVLSIPRDTRTWVEGYGVTKINDANAYGGPALSAKAVSELLGGVGVDRYVRINVQGVGKLIDALGGVTVNVPKDMKYQDDSQHLYINLKAGKQHLNGDQALQLLRFRYDENGDIGRIQRQQMVMRSLMEQTLNPVTLARLPKILNVVQSHLDTNLSVEELLALAGYATRINRANVKMLMVPGWFSDAGEYNASYWLPNHESISTMMAEFFGLGTGSWRSSDPSYVKVAVQNSTGQPGAAREMADILADLGYQNVYLDNPIYQSLSVTQIVAQQGNVESAEAVRQALGLGEVRIESTGALSSDITVQLGRDWLERGTLSGDPYYQ